MGNIVNKDLIVLFEKNIDQIETDLEHNKVVELGNDTVTKALQVWGSRNSY